MNQPLIELQDVSLGYNGRPVIEHVSKARADEQEPDDEAYGSG